VFNKYEQETLIKTEMAQAKAQIALSVAGCIDREKRGKRGWKWDAAFSITKE